MSSVHCAALFAPWAWRLECWNGGRIPGGRVCAALRAAGAAGACTCCRRPCLHVAIAVSFMSPRGLTESTWNVSASGGEVTQVRLAVKLPIEVSKPFGLAGVTRAVQPSLWTARPGR